MNSEPQTLPLLKVTRRAAERLRAGHLWVYRSDAELPEPAPAPGSLVEVTDARNAVLGTALFSSTSQIIARLVSPEHGVTRELYLQQLAERIDEAFARRAIIAPLGVHTTAQRLLFSEADNTPGIIADRYGELVLVQLLTQGTAQDDVRAVVVASMRKHLEQNEAALTMWERPDPKIRELEELAPPPNDGLLYSNQPDKPTTATFALNDLSYHYSAATGQKTGAFLDQRLNYAAAAAHVKASGLTGRALDVCTYQGGFALHLATVCEHVTGIDQSHGALETADWNLSLNPQLAGRVDWIEADAFDLLRAFDDAHNKPDPRNPELPLDVATGFDAIVLDPPAFAKSKRALAGALRGYKELNLRAMRLLNPGGTLITNSCSHHVSLAEFMETVASAARDAGRRVQLIETRAAAPDHPEVLALPETSYLKCLILRVE
ncbi:MAG: class I SAM-dependent rRNA methyltransferase [Acidobacteriaceae bacterium]|nr:class I SAM-dependent rRNA methyltransferase [Acidobacteriaceae bacterium]